MQNQSFNASFDAIFGDAVRFASNSGQIIEDITRERRSPENFRRIIEDADVEYERRITDRRMHGPECMAGFCTCATGETE